MSILRAGAISLALAFSGVTASAVSAAPSPPSPVLRQMEGHWTGDGIDLIIDLQRSQARIDPQLPFGWKAFVVTNVTGDMVVFFIGRMRFVGTLIDGRLMLNGTGFSGSRTLLRAP